MVLKSPEFPKNYFVPGRMAMTCCEADMTFLGFICKAREARNLETKQWVKVRAKIAYEFWPDYDGVGPVLYAESVEPAQEIKDNVLYKIVSPSGQLDSNENKKQTLTLDLQEERVCFLC